MMSSTSGTAAAAAVTELVDEADTAVASNASGSDSTSTNLPERAELRGEQVTVLREAGCLPATILLIDDDQQVLNVLGEMLRLEGHDVYTAENGLIALSILNRQQFDLVITDLIMPEKEGLETIAEIRRDYGSMPIIAISGGGRGGPMNYLETARYIGADRALKKPFQRRELIAAVRELLSTGGAPTAA